MKSFYRERDDKANTAITSTMPTRRLFLGMAGAQGIVLPAACAALYDVARPSPAAAAKPAHKPGHKGAIRPDPGLEPAQARIVRDFMHPKLELIRLLHEAAEIEHALMVQYLYAAFSLKPEYEQVRGTGAPNVDDLVGVAVQEMQHLGAVNRLLVDLGAAPHMGRQDFPYEPDLYPFPFHLEPLSRHSLAKYVFTEAPEDALDIGQARSAEDRRFLAELRTVLGGDVRPNHVGTLYGTIIDLVSELQATPNTSRHPDLDAWKVKLEDIKGEGEIDHYHFFRNLFMGRDAGFGQQADIWKLAQADPAYPSYRLPLDPSAYKGHPNEIENPVALGLAWLGNLEYWTTLSLLDIHYREDGDAALDLARAHMLGPLWSMATYLPKLGAGMPFDPLSLGYAPGRTPAERVRFTALLVREAAQVAHALDKHLPGDFPAGQHAETIAALETDLLALLPAGNMHR
ncbi:hypothetical protein GGE65_000946 [Skermanella aerolata]|uniref:ferritin-like domain-containing protein n=1 Tax=Skermanella aerolata TaxID=393310 RepID=UPI003D1ACF53